MTHKTDKQFFFETGLNWLYGDKAVLYAHDVKEVIHVTAPAAFGGTGKEWSPEHLLLSAIISCYMSTWLGISKKMDIRLSRFECSAIGQVELADGRYQFTNINVYPKIYIDTGTCHEKAAAAAEKTQQHCIISNSLNARVIYHTAILATAQAADADAAVKTD